MSESGKRVGLVRKSSNNQLWMKSLSCSPKRKKKESARLVSSSSNGVCQILLPSGSSTTEIFPSGFSNFGVLILLGSSQYLINSGDFLGRFFTASTGRIDSSRADLYMKRDGNRCLTERICDASVEIDFCGQLCRCAESSIFRQN